jgi:hypothetical protein
MEYFLLFFIHIFVTDAILIPNFKNNKILNRYIKIKRHHFYSCIMNNIPTKDIKKTGKLLSINKQKYINSTSNIILEKGKSVSTYDFTLELIKEAEKNSLIDKNNKDIIFFILISVFEMEVYKKKKRLYYVSIIFIFRNIIIPYIIHENTINILHFIKEKFNI